MTNPVRGTRPRPAFLNLWQITLPVGALTSICHRLSGVTLAMGVPALLYLMQRSLDGEAGFAAALAMLQPLWARLLLVALAWALAHHVLAGIRHMLTDVNVGSTLVVARRSALGVNVGALVIATLAAGVLL